MSRPIGGSFLQHPVAGRRDLGPPACTRLREQKVGARRHELLSERLDETAGIDLALDEREDAEDHALAVDRGLQRHVGIVDDGLIAQL
ncbi:MAG: hypothetical protein KJS95_12720, partial [Gammaproteobacteria bacterium]|nr:hypothetical protein [Gammaproteobacteria bacterium]